MKWLAEEGYLLSSALAEERSRGTMDEASSQGTWFTLR
jgi:hypothetical protein